MIKFDREYVLSLSVNSMDDEFIRWQNHIAIALFTWASYHHHQAHVGFSDLRKDWQGDNNQNDTQSQYISL